MANQNFEKLSDLEEYLMNKIQEAMKGVGSQGENIVKEHVENIVYDSYTPDEDGYVRTGELKSSVTNQVNKVETYAVEAMIYHDLTKMTAVGTRTASNNYITQHHSIVKNYDPQDYLPYIIETVNYGITEGKKKIFGNGIYSQSRPYMDVARTNIRKQASSLMKHYLKYEGVNSIIW